MRRLFTAIATAIVSATLMVHGQSPEAAQAIDNLTTIWFVQLSSPPAIDGTQTDGLNREESSFHEAARGDGIRYQVRQRFTGLFNGYSLRASATDAARLRTLPGVTAVHPVQTVSLPPVETAPGTNLDADHRAQADRRRHRAERTRPDGPRRERGGHRYRDRLRPPRPRRMLRPRMPGQKGSTSSATRTTPTRRSRLQPVLHPIPIPTTATATART